MAVLARVSHHFDVPIEEAALLWVDSGVFHAVRAVGREDLVLPMVDLGVLLLPNPLHMVVNLSLVVLQDR